MARLVHIFRHPVKSHGREEMPEVVLEAGESLPWDRRWAVKHEASKADGSTWVPCANFSRGAKAPGLMAISAKVTGNDITFTHPDLDPITLNPDTDGDKLVAWAAPVMPQNRAASIQVVRAQARAMTDTDYASVSLNTLPSLADLSAHMGTDLSPLRFRGNFWFEDLPAWEEFNWVGKTLKLGGAVLECVEPITRCRATMANPETGAIDADTLGTLRDTWGHQDFGVYTRVVQGGPVRLGDTLTVE